jgi:hypothetical protein
MHRGVIGLLALVLCCIIAIVSGAGCNTQNVRIRLQFSMSTFKNHGQHCGVRPPSNMAPETTADRQLKIEKKNFRLLSQKLFTHRARPSAQPTFGNPNQFPLLDLSGPNSYVNNPNYKFVRSVKNGTLVRVPLHRVRFTWSFVFPTLRLALNIILSAKTLNYGGKAPTPSLTHRKFLCFFHANLV